jgi:hypothetical protein
MQFTREFDFDQLRKTGYTKLGWRFDSDWCAKAIHELNEKKKRAEHKALIPNHFFDSSVLHPSVIKTVQELFGSDFCFHHANGYSHAFSDPYKRLHHDHDAVLDGNKDVFSMVHLLIYPAGIDDSSGNLAVVPGSHLLDVPRNLLDTSDADRARLEYLHCEPGEVFLVYSSLWHGRGPMNDPTKIRFHLNFSYCRREGPRKELLEWQGHHNHLRSVLPSNLHGYLLPETVTSASG